MVRRRRIGFRIEDFGFKKKPDPDKPELKIED
ncbi:hypothetical protein ES703_97141 [subsurface metagenome]